MESQPGNGGPTTPAIVLKKYGNRRLYDTSASRYVTLVEVEAMVQGGKDVLVIDAKSGKDLTKEVMVQLILERDGARAALPTSLLKQAVRMANSPLKDGLVRAMQEGLDGFLSGQRAVVDAQRTLMAQMGQLTPWVPTTMSVPSALWNPLIGPPAPGPGGGPPVQSQHAGQSAAGPSSQTQQQQQAQQQQNTADLDVLKAELFETQALVRKLLEREVNKAAPKAKKAPAKTRARVSISRAAQAAAKAPAKPKKTRKG